MPRISVIVQSHNRPQGLRRALLSLQMQSFRDFEVVISDDSVTMQEAVQEVLAGPAAAGLDIRFRMTAPCGAAESMREAFGRSTGEYIKILHDDDWLTPFSLEHQALVLDANTDANVVYGQAVLCQGLKRPSAHDKLLYTFAEDMAKVASANWVSSYEQTGHGPIQSPVAALYRRHDRFRIVWDEYLDPDLREAARRTGAGTDVNLQVDNAGSNQYIVLIPRIVCFMGLDMQSTTHTDPDIKSYYALWKAEYDTRPAWRY